MFTLRTFTFAMVALAALFIVTLSHTATVAADGLVVIDCPTIQTLPPLRARRMRAVSAPQIQASAPRICESKITTFRLRLTSKSLLQKLTRFL